VSNFVGLNPVFLEAYVVVLGIVLLMVEAFVPRLKKSAIAYAGMIGLGLALIATFFCTPSAIPADAAYAAYYTGDALAIFFKQFALLTTILVL